MPDAPDHLPTNPAAIAGHVCAAADAFAARYPRRHNWNDGEWCVVEDDLATGSGGRNPARRCTARVGKTRKKVESTANAAAIPLPRQP